MNPPANLDDMYKALLPPPKTCEYPIFHDDKSTIFCLSSDPVPDNRKDVIIAVRTIALSVASPVLAAKFSDVETARDTGFLLDWTDYTFEEVVNFLGLVLRNDSSPLPPEVILAIPWDVKQMIKIAFPLIHKYECSGLLNEAFSMLESGKDELDFCQTLFKYTHTDARWREFKIVKHMYDSLTWPGIKGEEQGKFIQLIAELEPQVCALLALLGVHKSRDLNDDQIRTFRKLAANTLSSGDNASKTGGVLGKRPLQTESNSSQRDDELSEEEGK